MDNASPSNMGVDYVITFDFAAAKGTRSLSLHTFFVVAVANLSDGVA